MAKDKLVRSPRKNGRGQDAQKDLHLRTGRDEKKWKIQEKMERGSRKRSSSAGREKMKRVGGRQEKMEGHCSTGQGPQWAVTPMEEGRRRRRRRRSLWTKTKTERPMILGFFSMTTLDVGTRRHNSHLRLLHQCCQDDEIFYFHIQNHTAHMQGLQNVCQKCSALETYT